MEADKSEAFWGRRDGRCAAKSPVREVLRTAIVIAGCAFYQLPRNASNTLHEPAQKRLTECACLAYSRYLELETAKHCALRCLPLLN